MKYAEVNGLGCNVVYVSRTHAQINQVCREWRRSGMGREGAVLLGSSECRVFFCCVVFFFYLILIFKKTNNCVQ